jgi:hypothetical protein
LDQTFPGAGHAQVVEPPAGTRLRAGSDVSDALAGGGTLLTFPALLPLMNPTQANMTSTIAASTQTMPP